MYVLAGSLLTLATALCVYGATQTPLSDARASSTVTGGYAQRIITSELSKFARGVVDNGTLPGLSLGVVYSHHKVEFGTWGIKAEEGDAMTTDVSVYEIYKP